MKKSPGHHIEFENQQKQCLFCDELLPKHIHKLRRYCPSKYGINDYCKYKHKKLLEQARQAGENPIVNISDPIEKVPQIQTKEHFSANVNLSEATEDLQSIKENNLKILVHLMLGKIELKVSLKTLFKIGYDLNVYDTRLPFLKTQEFYHEIGDYALIWYLKDVILITYITETIWLQQ